VDDRDALRGIQFVL